MYFSSFLSILLPLLSFIPSIHAWDCSLLFQEELQNLGFTQLASLLTTINQTSVGQDLISKISQGNFTFFAPTNEAIGNVSSQVSGNTTLFAEYLSYHFVHGNFQNVSSESYPTSSTTSESATSTSTTSSSTSETSTETSTATATLLGRLFRRRSSQLDSSSPSPPQLESGIFPNTTLGRTLLNASELVQLPGNNSQVLAWTRNDENSNVTILNQVSNIDSSQNITVINSTQWGTIFINRINGVLTPPGNITTALNATNATITFNLLESIQVPSSNGTNVTATEFLQDAVGITFFAPNNAAFIGLVNETISSLQNNVSALVAVLENHYINGTVLYSPEIQVLGQNSSNSSSSDSSSSTTNATSAAGEPFQFVTNSSGTFVESNGLSAKIVRPDVLIDNGVIHIIDTVLLNNASDPAAASSAYASATSAAASITTETGPIGVPTSTASSESSTSTSSSESSSSTTTSSESATSTTSTSETTTSGGTLTVTASA